MAPRWQTPFQVPAFAKCRNLMMTIGIFSKYATRALIRPLYHVLRNHVMTTWVFVSVIEQKGGIRKIKEEMQTIWFEISEVWICTSTNKPAADKVPKA